MNAAFLIVTVLFMLVSLAMVLIILVQRPSGGGLAGAFGGAGGSGSDTVFGGRVGDALTWATVAAFVLYLAFAITLNLLDNAPRSSATSTPAVQAPLDDSTDPVLFTDIPVDDFPPAETPSGDSSEGEVDPVSEDTSNPDGGGDN